MGWLTWLTVVHHPSSIVSCHVANGDMAPTSRMNRGGRGVRLLTLSNVDRDDNMCHHRLDNGACPLMCQVIFTICRLKRRVYRACDVALPHCPHHWGVQWWWGAVECQR